MNQKGKIFVLSNKISIEKMEKYFNPLKKILLRSPLHSVAGKDTVLIIYTDRKTGASHSVPLRFVKDDRTLYALTQKENLWWHQIRNGAAVKIILEGKQYSGWATVYENNEKVVDEMRMMYSKFSQNSYLLNIRSNQDGTLNEDDLRSVARDRVVIAITYS